MEGISAAHWWWDSTVEREVDRSRSCSSSSSRRRIRVRFAPPFIVSSKSSSTATLDFIKLCQHMKPADSRERQETHNMQGSEWVCLSVCWLTASGAILLKLLLLLLLQLMCGYGKLMGLPGALLTEALFTSSSYGFGSFGMHLTNFVSSVIVFGRA